VEQFIFKWKRSSTTVGKNATGIQSFLQSKRYNSLGDTLKRWVAGLQNLGNGIPFRNEAVAFRRVCLFDLFVYLVSLFEFYLGFFFFYVGV
jgi:hypothetical protein